MSVLYSSEARGTGYSLYLPKHGRRRQKQFGGKKNLPEYDFFQKMPNMIFQKFSIKFFPKIAEGIVSSQKKRNYNQFSKMTVV